MDLQCSYVNTPSGGNMALMLLEAMVFITISYLAHFVALLLV